MRKSHVFVVVIGVVAFSAPALVGCASSTGSDARPAGEHGAMQQPARGSGQSPEAYLSDTRPIEGSRAVLTVYGLGCPLCAENINKTLAAIPGVAGSDVDMATGFVSVRFAGGQRPSRADLARAIVDSGFTLVRIDVPNGGA